MTATGGSGQETPLDEAALNAWVGRSMEATDDLTRRLVAEYRVTLDPHLAPVAEGEAPLAIHWCLAPPMTPMAEVGPDGHAARGGFLPPVPLPRRMWAGGEVETFAPLRVGEAVTRRSRIESVRMKEGRTGRLCFVAVRHEVFGGDGLALTERHDIVYRGADAGPPRSPPAAPPRRADLAWQVEGSEVLLFRYSALTFNSHRIHYDHPYVTGVEGYPGLVIHGPIQSTLLFNLAGVLGGRAPRRFTYRGLSPLFVPDTFAVEGVRTESGVECWTRSGAGYFAMQAEATW